MDVAGYFPEDLTRDILMRIPVKSLSRFRCVHKTWDSLFKSSSFIITHLNNSNKKGHNLMLVMIPKYVITDKSMRLRFRLFNRDTFNVYLDIEALRMTWPNYPIISRYPLVGFCNGLVCLHMYSVQPEQIVLYNPCLKQHKIIHPPLLNSNVNSDFLDSRVLGFGYDSINNDYKVVYWRKGTQAQLYTLGTNSWRNVDPPDTVTFINVLENFQAYLNGAIHWWGISENQKNGCHVVISFKVCREEFQVFQLPDCVPRGKPIGIYVCRGLLCVSMATIMDHLNQCYDIWAMGKYGVPESWSRLFVVNNERLPDDCSYFRGIGMNGELVWSRQYPGRLRVMVNYSDNEESHNIEFDDEDFPLFPVVSYTESLVSLK